MDEDVGAATDLKMFFGVIWGGGGGRGAGGGG